ncbi:MAG: hypothetical protein NTW76_01920 [Corynebacteriales bacterium]|nr:hypothetical protein [Mycobacteriales bacterium]
MTEPGVDRNAVAALIVGGDVEWIDADSEAARALPEVWQAIVAARSAPERVRAAMARWDHEFVDLLPRFAALMREQLIDVVPAVIAGDQVLIYVTTDGDAYAPWVGTDPSDFGEVSPIWDVLPEPLRAFQRNTHPGFGLTWPGVYGIRTPADQISRYERLELADLGVAPEEAVIGEYDGEPVREDEVNLLSFDEAQAFYCVSPRFRVGEIVFIHYDDFDVVDLWPTLDDIMLMPYRNVVY